MSPADPGGARAALGAARAAIDRLDPSRHPDELAADLLDAWTAVEDVLRGALGGGATAGMQLVREARRRQLLTFDQANALAALSATSDRTRDPAYHPTAADLDAARQAFAALDALAGRDVSTPIGSGSSPTPDASPVAPPAVPSPTPPRQALDRRGPEPVSGPEPGRVSHALRWIALLTLLVIIAAGAAYYWVGGPRRDGVLEQAMAEYEAGNLDSATVDFRRVVLMDPDSPIAHVYLARIARRAGNLAAANVELQLALTADPASFLALREMGAYLFTAGQYELARKFYVRAVAANPQDPAAQGFLGCTLVKLGRIDEGERWITRAGPGTWTRCVSGATPPDTLH